jgi:hypothetical protein
MFNSLINQEKVQRYGREAHSKGNLETSHQSYSKLDRELQEWEVESIKGGGDLNQ